MNNNNFHVAWCPFCNQGWVEIVKDAGNGKMLLLCAECDTTWDNPNDLKFDKPIEDYKLIGNLEIPSINEVQEIGWDKRLIS